MNGPLLLLLVAFFAKGESCPESKNTDELYNFWFSVAVELRKEDGEVNHYARIPSESEAKEAWACLERAGGLGNCKALHVLELYNRHGMGKSSFGVEVNIEKADAYRQKMKVQCSDK